MTKDTPSWRLTAGELGSAIRAGRISARVALENQIARIDALNPKLNAVVSLDLEAARRQAEQVDAARDRGEPLGPLAGVPITLKDGIDVACLRTTLGARELDRIADADASVAARLKQAGAVILGHSNVAPFLGDFQTNNAVFGRSLNPWAAERTPGGSSGGAAAAVAAGLSSFEVASDLAGSIRQPAAFCGVYGLKPSERRVPMTGFFNLPGPRPVRILSCLGPLARSLDDLLLVLDVISGPDGADHEIAPVPLGSSAAPGLAGLRVAVAPELPFCKVARSLSDEVERLANALEGAGVQLTRTLPGVDWSAAQALFGELATELTGPDQTQSLSWYLHALARRDGIMSAWDRFFEEVDFVVWPSGMSAAYPHCEPGQPVVVDGQPFPYFAQVGALIPANLAGVPALAAPAARDTAGLPLGVQLIGPRWRDFELIGFAKALEEVGILPGFAWPKSLLSP
ncbi:MAG: amidase family protein [Polyangiaceae bacterium]